MRIINWKLIFFQKQLDLSGVSDDYQAILSMTFTKNGVTYDVEIDQNHNVTLHSMKAT